MRSRLQGFNARGLGLPLPSPAGVVLVGFLIGALPVCSVASASGVDRKAVQAQYQRERAACLSGESHQERSICLREAGAARHEALRGGLETATGLHEQNRLARCDPLPVDLREDCQRRMRGEGTVSGSAEQGGVLRELRTTVPAR